MKITVRLFATLRENRGKIVDMDIEKPFCGLDILAALGIAEKDVAIYLINGRDGALSYSLNEGDILSVFPPVGGG